MNMIDLSLTLTLDAEITEAQRSAVVKRVKSALEDNRFEGRLSTPDLDDQGISIATVQVGPGYEARLRQSLSDFVEWARNHTSPRDVNSPHEILVRAVEALSLPHDSAANMVPSSVVEEGAARPGVSLPFCRART